MHIQRPIKVYIKKKISSKIKNRKKRLGIEINFTRGIVHCSEADCIVKRHTITLSYDPAKHHYRSARNRPRASLQHRPFRICNY